ncbi:cobalamin biosynthesis protein [Mycolicibacter senuensis]|uniref:Cobalamin biosynthesis protein CobD n=1 Tax=Mycolicibacter senuensis TaxID=386913 RepID=A0A7I9XFW6_9MYCO|nr:cobalamin biosynthesis protein [Mycolicibacter senuensis]MDQ2629334.1 cobalamin biosynthesis protein [Actinomycetota bacterium]ORW64807.1 cobalamin biosynthesis protein [Mycolicibacter senuensis]GFG68420.1 cobalamin biosynthesis protein CobD [Mycolicibacter senuensis]
MTTARALGLLLGYAADRAWGDPRRLHPVAGFGTCALAVERRLYRDSRASGIAHVLVLVGGVTGLAYLGERAVRSRLTQLLFTASATWAVLGGRSLECEACAVHDFLAAGDLQRARVQLRSLVGRDTAMLGPDEIARAVAESVAENTSDAVVASLLWGAVAGVPGLVAHRAVNTLDAMIGHRNARYERFGWAAARLDDLLGLPASRLTGVLAAAFGPDPVGALRSWRRDARHHPSPNAGVVEASFAGALGLQLGGVNIYDGNRREDRALLGHGRAPVLADIPRAVRLARRVGAATVAGAVVWCLIRKTRR